MNKESTIIVEEGHRRWLAILLLAALIFGSVFAVGMAAWLYANHAEHKHVELLRDVRQQLEHAADERSRISYISVTAQTLILESAQQQSRLQLCVLRPRMRNFCRGVLQDSKKVVVAIEQIQRDISRFIVEIQPKPEPIDNPVTQPLTPPAPTPTQSPSETRGESDQCPENNPHC